jgi:hypothetical protein
MAHCGTDGTATLVLRADPAGRFDAGVTDNGAVPVTFVVGESVSSPTVAQIRDDALALDIVLLDAEPGEGYLALSELDASGDDYLRPAEESERRPPAAVHIGHHVGAAGPHHRGGQHAATAGVRQPDGVHGRLKG